MSRSTSQQDEIFEWVTVAGGGIYTSTLVRRSIIFIIVIIINEAFHCTHTRCYNEVSKEKKQRRIMRLTTDEVGVDDDDSGAGVGNLSLTWPPSTKSFICASLTDNMNVIRWHSDWRVRILSDMLYVVKSRETSDIRIRKYCEPSNRNVVTAADIRQKRASLPHITVQLCTQWVRYITRNPHAIARMKPHNAAQPHSITKRG